MPTKTNPKQASSDWQHNDVLIALENVGIRRDNHWQISNISLKIHQGEIMTLIGPNGAGKSTTAKVILGVIKPDQGTITRKPSLRIGYVPQKLAIDQSLPMSVERLMRLKNRYSSQEINEILEQVGIPHLRHKQVHHLSGGEFQRALLARAMLSGADLLVLDEPVQGVDYIGESQLYDLITDIRDKTGCGILLISHDLHIVMAQTDTVICLNQHICCQGSPTTIIKEPAYDTFFHQDLSKSIAIYKHSHDHVHTDDGQIIHAHEHDDT